MMRKVVAYKKRRAYMVSLLPTTSPTFFANVIEDVIFYVTRLNIWPRDFAPVEVSVNGRTLRTAEGFDVGSTWFARNETPAAHLPVDDWSFRDYRFKENGVTFVLRPGDCVILKVKSLSAEDKTPYEVVSATLSGFIEED